MKFKGAEIKRFWEELPEGVLHEEGPFEPAGDGALHWVEELALGQDYSKGPIIRDEDTYNVTYGLLSWQDAFGPTPRDFTEDLVLAMKRWKKAQTTVTLVVTVPKEQEESARALLREHKWGVK